MGPVDYRLKPVGVSVWTVTEETRREPEISALREWLGQDWEVEAAELGIDDDEEGALPILGLTLHNGPFSYYVAAGRCIAKHPDGGIRVMGLDTLGEGYEVFQPETDLLWSAQFVLWGEGLVPDLDFGKCKVPTRVQDLLVCATRFGISIDDESVRAAAAGFEE